MFSRKHDAVRAARRKLGPEARETKEFSIFEKDGKFDWVALTGGANVEQQPTSYDYKGYKLSVASENPPLVQVFDPRFSGPAADYETTSLDLAMRWVDAYRDGVTWAVQAKLSPTSEPAAVETEQKPAERKRRSRRADAKAAIDAAQDRAEASLDHAEKVIADPLASEWPTSFVPDVEAGEIASREYGMLTTRERAVEAAAAAGASDAKVTQTARGMWVWRTQQLDRVWQENAVADLKNPDHGSPAPKGSKKRAAASKDGRETPRKPGERGSRGPKLQLTVGLLKRPEGATAEEIASATGWSIPSANCRVTTDVKITLGYAVVAAKEPGRGKVYRIAA